MPEMRSDSRSAWALVAALATASLLAHAAGIWRTPLPAQDGIKFLKAARAFHTEPFVEVVRGLDQHPGYPLLVAGLEPVVGWVVGDGPDAWRIAGQLVSLGSHFGTMLALGALGTTWFGPRAGALAAATWLLAPLPAELGHDTLSDPAAIGCWAVAAWGGAWAARSGRPRDAILPGLAAGLGFWVRPEVALVGLAIVAVLALAGSGRRKVGLAAVAVLALAIPIAGYAAVKGSLSEKLAARRAAPTRIADGPATPVKRLPDEWTDPRWDFAPKEESRREPIAGVVGAAVAVPRRLADAVGIPGLALAIVGLWVGWRSAPRAARVFTALYGVGFALVLVRHASGLGYLSGRHVLGLAALLTPWIAVGAWRVWALVPEARSWGWIRVRPRWVGAVAVAVVIVSPARGEHPTRWGHRAAGLWLSDHARADAKVLDTRGWARFVSGTPGYDAWHVGQALTDDRVGYVVVGADELAAPSRRAETLRALLRRAGREVAAFPAREGEDRRDVLVYRFDPPAEWCHPAGTTP